MARFLKPLVRSGGYYPSRRWTPLVYPGGYTTANGGEEPAPPPIEKTITGNPIHITDALAKPAQALSVKLEPIQDLHGYDNPWPAGGGKNKFDKSVSPVTGYVSTAGAYISYASGGEMCLVSPLIKAGTYTISKISSARFRVGLFENQPSGTDMASIDFWTADPQTSTQLTITTTADGYLIIFCYNGASESVTIQQISDSLQIEAGSTASAWTPYSNLCPIYGHTDADVTRTGKNLIPTPVAANAIKYNGGGLSVADVTNGVAVTGQASGSSHSVGFILLDADYFIGRTLTLSLAMVGSNSSPRAVVMYCDADCTNRSVVQVLNDTGSITFTVSSTAKGKKIGLGLFSTSGQDSLSAVSTYTNIQLELGSTATDYEEYRGTTYPIPLGQTVYGGTLDVTAGKMVVDRAMVDLGSLSWRYESAWGAFVSSLSDAKRVNSAQDANWISSIFYLKGAHYSGSTAPDLSVDCNSVAHSAGTFTIKDTEYWSDANAFKTAMSGVQFVYELATPLTIQLTAQQVELLQGENNLFSDGEMTLVYLADGNASEIEALNILLGGRYVNNHEADEPTDREALDILLGR